MKRFPTLCVSLLLIMPSVASPQRGAAGTGTVAGAVRDPNGVLPGVAITATAGETEFKAVTDPQGRYVIASLPAEPLTIRATLAGFCGSEKVVSLEPGGRTTVDFDLRPAKLSTFIDWIAPPEQLADLMAAAQAVAHVRVSAAEPARECGAFAHIQATVIDQLKPATDASWIGDEGIRECEVWIEDDQQRELAEAIVREVAATGEAWRCRTCGEEIEPQFTECWKCGASSADGKKLPRRPPRRARPASIRHAETGTVVSPETVRHGLERIRKRRLLNVVAVVGCLPVIAVLLFVVPLGLADAVIPVTFLTVGVITMFRRESLCPRCGRSFFHAKWKRFGDMETWSRCAHCELRVDGSNLDA